MSTSNYVTINGNKIHYLSEGEGKPVVFIHGIPTSSYIWRNIMPKIATKNQCIALDLIGMGQSDKPQDIEYSIYDHINYFTQFVKALDLKNINIMMHGWGSIIGFAYAQNNADNVQGLAFVEGYVNLPENPRDIPLPVQEISSLVHDPVKMEYLVVEQNQLVEKLLPGITLNKVGEDQLAVYRKPFEKKENRKVLLQFALEQPYRNPQSPAHELIKGYSSWLQTTPIRKLMMYGVPGFLTNMNTVQWATTHLPNLTVVDVGHGLHYLPESRHAEITETLSRWL